MAGHGHSEHGSGEHDDSGPEPWQLYLMLPVFLIVNLFFLYVGWKATRTLVAPQQMPMRATKMVAHRGMRGSVDVIDPAKLAMDVERASTSRSSIRNNVHRGSTVSGGTLEMPIELTEGPQSVMTLLPFLSGLLMLVSPWIAFAVSWPVILALLGAIMYHRYQAGDFKAVTKLRFVALLFTIPRLSLRFPWATLHLILAAQAIYFIDNFSMALGAPPPIWRAAVDCDTDAECTAAAALSNSTDVPWWWGLFTTVYNNDFTLHLLLAVNLLFLVMYGLPAEAAWGPVRTYAMPLVVCFIFPFILRSYHGLLCGRWSTGSSVLVTALTGSVISHSTINAHRWPGVDLPHIFALFFWAWLFMVPISYFPGGACLKAHGAGFALGSTGAMISAPMFGQNVCGTSLSQIDQWRWLWSVVGTVLAVATIVIGAFVSS
jgi:hypothetical protein